MRRRFALVPVKALAMEWLKKAERRLKAMEDREKQTWEEGENKVSLIGTCFSTPITSRGENKRAIFILRVMTTVSVDGVPRRVQTTVPVVGWDEMVEPCARLAVGNKVRITGTLRNWKGQDGKFVLEVKANAMQVMSSSGAADKAPAQGELVA